MSSGFGLQSCLVVGALALVPNLALAHSDLKTVSADPVKDSATYCTFPDGTHPPRSGIHCYDPKTFLEAYGIDRLHKLGITGKGQTIILVDAFGSPTMQADLDSFSDTFGLPRKTIQFIYPNGVYVNPLTKDDPANPGKKIPDDDKIGWAGETTLDLEWAHAIAPDAELVNVITNVSETEGMAGLPELFHGIELAAAKYPNGIVSMSFGTGEQTFTIQQIDDSLKGSFHDIFARATQAGMTLLAATGDNGTAGMGLDLTSMMDIRSTDYPASDPLITAVGGTALEYGWTWTPQGTAEDFMDCKSRQAQQRAMNPDSKPADCPMDFLSSVDVANSRIESVWKEDWAMAAGGGGVSAVFEAPDFQKGLSLAVSNQLSGNRGIPDVSMNAAVNGGVMMYQSYQTGAKPSPVWTSSGGTSAATPEMAGLVALAGQRASEQLGRQVGIGALNEILYSLGAEAFHDVVSQTFGAQKQVVIDNNGLYFSGLALQIFGPTTETPVQVPGYYTTPGYDLASGLGTPVADRFVEDIAQARVARESHRLP